MKKSFKKIKNRAGETLVETLAAILVAALSAAMLAMGIMTSTKAETNITAFQKEIEAQANEAEICEGTEGLDDAAVILYVRNGADGAKIALYDESGNPLTDSNGQQLYYEQSIPVIVTGGEDKITSFKIKSAEEDGD